MEGIIECSVGRLVENRCLLVGRGVRLAKVLSEESINQIFE